jgi:hypothetical protein
MHTLLGVRAFQVEQHAENASADSNLLLQWHWGFNDVIQVANIATIGALYTSISGLGNEPNMCASFAAGVALRMFVHDNAAVLTQNLLDSVTSSLPVQFVSLDAVRSVYDFYHSLTYNTRPILSLAYGMSLEHTRMRILNRY